MFILLMEGFFAKRSGRAEGWPQLSIRLIFTFFLLMIPSK